MITTIGRRRLTLSFDNGPWADGTEAILETLGSRNLKATFFVVGKRLADPGARRWAQAAHDQGHWIGNHTLNHGQPLGTQPNAMETPEREIGEMQAMLGSLAHPDRLFRPNGKGALGPHLLSTAAADYLASNSYTIVTWNNVPRDWVEPRRDWVGRALETLANQDWSLLVVHDHNLRHAPGSLDAFLDAALEQGVDIVQPFPPSCLPMIRGRAEASLATLITPSSVI